MADDDARDEQIIRRMASAIVGGKVFGRRHRRIRLPRSALVIGPFDDDLPAFNVVGTIGRLGDTSPRAVATNIPVLRTEGLTTADVPYLTLEVNGVPVPCSITAQSDRYIEHDVTTPYLRHVRVYAEGLTTGTWRLYRGDITRAALGAQYVIAGPTEGVDYADLPNPVAWDASVGSPGQTAPVLTADQIVVGFRADAPDFSQMLASGTLLSWGPILCLWQARRDKTFVSGDGDVLMYQIQVNEAGAYRTLITDETNGPYAQWAPNYYPPTGQATQSTPRGFASVLAIRVRTTGAATFTPGVTALVPGGGLTFEVVRTWHPRVPFGVFLPSDRDRLCAFEYWGQISTDTPAQADAIAATALGLSPGAYTEFATLDANQVIAEGLLMERFGCWGVRTSANYEDARYFTHQFQRATTQADRLLWWTRAVAMIGTYIDYYDATGVNTLFPGYSSLGSNIWYAEAVGTDVVRQLTGHPAHAAAASYVGGCLLWVGRRPIPITDPVPRSGGRYPIGDNRPKARDMEAAIARRLVQGGDIINATYPWLSFYSGAPGANPAPTTYRTTVTDRADDLLIAQFAVTRPISAYQVLMPPTNSGIPQDVEGSWGGDDYIETTVPAGWTAGRIGEKFYMTDMMISALGDYVRRINQSRLDVLDACRANFAFRDRTGTFNEGAECYVYISVLVDKPGSGGGPDVLFPQLNGLTMDAMAAMMRAFPAESATWKARLARIVRGTIKDPVIPAYGQDRQLMERARGLYPAIAAMCGH